MNSLRILDVFYGNKCNLTCYQCDTRSDIFRKGEHDSNIDTIKEGVVLASKHFKIENYSLLGGEPLLNIEIVTELLKFIRSFDKHTPILMPTNGSLIDRNFDVVKDWLTNYGVRLSVCDHFSAFEDKDRSNQVKLASYRLADSLGMTEGNPRDFHYDVLNFGSSDENWVQWITPRQSEFSDSENERYWAKENFSIFLHDQDYFQQHHYFSKNKPKPFAEGDPEASYRNGCCSPFCTYLYDKKLYKCGALGTLERFLRHHDAIDDPAWFKYLSYKPLDLVNCTEEEVKVFSDTKFKAIAECDMCPASGQEYRKTPETTLPSGKKYVPINRVE